MPSINATSTSTSNNVIPFPGWHPSGDLFLSGLTPTSTGIVGLIIKRTHAPCRACGAVHFIIGSSAAMHCARLTCAECGVFSGWLPKGDFTFHRMTVDKFGPPTGAFAVRNPEEE